MSLDAPTLRELAVNVSQYFLDFLESDFKKQQAPRRRIILQSEAGFRAGMRVSHYPGLHAALWTLLNTCVEEESSLEVRPHQYTRPISSTLRKVIEEHVRAIEPRSVEAVRRAVVEKAVQSLSKAVDNPEEWIDGIRGTLATELGTEVIRPLLGYLDGPLSQQAYSVIDSIYSAEGDLIARVGSDLDSVLPDVLARFSATQNVEPLRQAVSQFLTLDGLQSALLGYFESFASADAFLEFRDVETFAATNEGYQLYLYVGALKYRNVQYPLFFMPIDVERASGSPNYKVRVVNHLYANRRAIDFALQELSEKHGRIWKNPIRDRITYLTPEQSIFEVASPQFRNVVAAFDLPGQIELSSTAMDVGNTDVTISAALHIAAFERADEALLNDYEEIISQARQGGSAVVNLFEDIVKGIIVENPISIAKSVNESWDSLPLVDRVVFDSPIPLNEEQLKILAAIRNPVGKLIVVEGPPGTGKSHTITAIAADCALNNRSCLVLSDKTEALDVVHDKLSQAMNRVRHDKDFPNPVLRLGQQNANFKRLISTQALTQVTAYARAVQANKPQLDAEREDTKSTLQAAINGNVVHLGKVSLASLKRLHLDEQELSALAPEVLDTLHNHEPVAPELLSALELIEPHTSELQAYLTDLFGSADYTHDSLWRKVRLDAAVLKFAKRVTTPEFGLFEALDLNQMRGLSTCVLQYRQLHMPIFGYLFRGAAVRALETQINALGSTRPLLLKADAPLLERLLNVGNELRQALAAEKFSSPSDFKDAFAILSAGRLPLDGVAVALDAITILRKLNPNILDALLAKPEDDPRLWPLVIRFLSVWFAVRDSFHRAPDFDYVGTKSHLERLNTSSMNNEVDTRLVHFMDNHRADARILAKVISQRQKFPEDKFGDVKNSFPVIIASIREFGEFMPLAPDLFDVVVIDEASQVSVAQALPALLRARKVVVLGDSKQFSNVKSSNASIALNERYRADLRKFFERRVSQEASALQRLAMFDVKRSILEFCSLGASYATMLRKHFRSYQELIGYSSGTFYNHQLQAIKIRGVPMDEVIRFDLVDVANAKVTRGTNEAEANHILARLVELVDEDEPPTVGVITPFREQQTLLSRTLFGHARGRDFEDKLRLKVMTFDSCQGEERNIIFYSMVATPGNDALNYIFPVELRDAHESVEEKLKVQRLNVGFSRAQEMVWFVHSMPIDQYRGSIGQALNYYKNALEKSAATAEETDQQSPMEAKVLDWIQKTPFVLANLENLEILPQFPIGDYLRQLDPTYKHPAWRVDFLLTFRTSKGVTNIVVEYDGFEHHFVKGRDVHVGNHERYLLPADLERQLTLESYGYRFLRINRFNLGQDPVTTISERLKTLVERELGEISSQSVAKVQQQAAGLANGQLKPCSRCNRIQPMQAFFDKTLKNGEGGVGRVCMSCKRTDGAKGVTSGMRQGYSRRGRWR